MKFETWVTIILAGLAFFGSSLALFFKIGKVARGVEKAEEDVKEIKGDLCGYKDIHKVEHDKLDNLVYGNQRETSAISATLQEVLKWLERIDKKLDDTRAGSL
jgi:hypothetical protein